MSFTYQINVRDRDSGRTANLTPQEEALACPAIGSFFELLQRGQQVLAGTVVEASTIIDDWPQQDSGDVRRRNVVHAIVIASAGDKEQS